jgi:hypothetical protein
MKGMLREKCGFLRANTFLDCSKAATTDRFVYLGEFSPSLSTSRGSGFGCCLQLQRVLAMRLIKPIAALASVAAIGCSIFAFGWVGLALLGF